MRSKAVLFDLHGTLAYVENPASDRQASDFLVRRGYEVFPQAFRAAWQYVSFIDYPMHGYKTWESYLKRVLWRLKVKLDRQDLNDLVRLYREAGWKLFPDTEEALSLVKENKMKTAVVTTIARFKYLEALKPVQGKIDLLVDGHTFRCEKSNPRIYVCTLQALKVKASEAIKIGDEVDVDVLLPKRLGMRAILLDRTSRLTSGGCKEADAMVGNLEDAIEEVREYAGT
jgi:putative hydrolase of the HAD superfamily